MEEIYEVLTELESLAAAKAATRNLSNAHLAVMSQAITNMDIALAQDRREDWSVANDVFHSELIRLGGNERVRAIAKMLSDQVRRARLVTLYMRPTPTKSNDDHRHIVEAIRAGDPDRAREAHRKHLMAVKEELIKLLERHHLSSL
jgi:DNA-binding GntR family transcriptional regulator